MRELRSCRTLALTAVLFALSLIGGCTKSEPETPNAADGGPPAGQEHAPGDVVKREGEPPITYVADDDPAMQAAMKTAQKTVENFVRVLQSPGPNQSGFSVKVGIRDGEHSEAMWILPVEYDGSKFSGILNNEPDQVTTVKLGDRLESPRDEILDWMYVDDGKLVGGYTLRALRNRMTEEERKEFDDSLPFVVE